MRGKDGTDRGMETERRRWKEKDGDYKEERGTDIAGGIRMGGVERETETEGDTIIHEQRERETGRQRENETRMNRFIALNQWTM